MSKFVMVTCIPEEGERVKKEDFDKCIRSTFPRESKDVVVISLNDIEPEVLDKFIDMGAIDCFAFTSDTLGSDEGKKITSRVLTIDRKIGRNTQFLNVYNSESKENIETSIAIGNLMVDDGYDGNLLHFDINDDERIKRHNLIGVKNSTLRTKQKIKTKVHDVLKYADSVIDQVEEKVGEYTKMHMMSVATISEAIGKKAGLSAEEVEILKVGAMMHDIGKQDVSGSIINSGTRLTDDQFSKMQAHVLLGEIEFDMVDLDEFERAKVVADQHHERYDGKGYPRGLKGEEIDKLARILSVADSTNAMFGRDYNKEVKNVDQIIEELAKFSGLNLPEKSEDGKYDLASIDLNSESDLQFDPEYVKCMIDILQNSPEDILVEYDKNGKVKWMDQMEELEKERKEKINDFSNQMKSSVNTDEELAKKDLKQKEKKTKNSIDDISK